MSGDALPRAFQVVSIPGLGSYSPHQVEYETSGNMRARLAQAIKESLLGAVRFLQRIGQGLHVGGREATIVGPLGLSGIGEDTYRRRYPGDLQRGRAERVSENVPEEITLGLFLDPLCFPLCFSCGPKHPRSGFDQRLSSQARRVERPIGGVLRGFCGHAIGLSSTLSRGRSCLMNAERDGPLSDVSRTSDGGRRAIREVRHQTVKFLESGREFHEGNSSIHEVLDQ